MARRTDMDVGKIISENLILESGKIIKLMAKVSIFGILEINTLATGMNF
jgi:hypothetical protein